MRTLQALTLGCFLWEIAVLHISLALGQPSGFISIDCGSKEASYVDSGTGITYTSDSNLTRSGEMKAVASDYIGTKPKYLWHLRTFPKGNRNCYTLQPLTPGTSKYLLRASFFYGNFDGLNLFPEFDLYLENAFVHTVNASLSDWESYEMIVKLRRSYLTLCLCRRNERDNPFISAIELRPLLGDAIYPVVNATLALKTFTRDNYGLPTGAASYRYPVDAFDRIWNSAGSTGLESINTTLSVSSTGSQYVPPSIVMQTADTNPNPKGRIGSSSVIPRGTYLFMCIHFAELKKLEANETREFNLTVDSKLWLGDFRPTYRATTTICSQSIYPSQNNVVDYIPTERSTLPPIVNALELYSALHLPGSATDDGDVGALVDIRDKYQITKAWTGDPCLPLNYAWEGLVCSNDTSSLRVLSLDLSNSGLNGEIPNSLANFSAIVNLNLSGNNLTGTIPIFLANLPQLRMLDLSNNDLSGTVPDDLLRKRKDGSLMLSILGNKELCSSGVCDVPPGPKPKPSKGIVIGVSVSAGLLFLMVASTIIVIKTKKRNPPGGNPLSNCSEEAILEMSPGRCQAFTFKEVEKITDNFREKIGKGGFGPVYLGHLKGQKVAVKVSSDESKQGFKEFHNEVELLSRAHHKHVSFLGYCHDAKRMILIYEYLSRGSLEDALSGKARVNLDWNQRLQIALDAAQGLDYLHSGCKPAIIHRDVKSANILLNDKLEAKIADFGLSKPVASEGVTHVTTAIRGTPGYWDPEYCGNCCLNEKSDVYSFGIVLLELVSGKRHLIDVPSGEKINIAHWVRQNVLEGKHANIEDPALCGRYEVDSLRRVVDLALHCTSDKGINRPKMCDVVTELKEAIRLCGGKQIQQESGKGSSSHNTDSDSAFIVPR